MKLNPIGAALTLAALMAVPGTDTTACTNLIAGKKATADGSVMITYAADSHNLYGMLTHTPAARHRPGEVRKVIEWDTNRWARFHSLPKPTTLWVT